MGGAGLEFRVELGAEEEWVVVVRAEFDDLWARKWGKPTDEAARPLGPRETSCCLLTIKLIPSEKVVKFKLHTFY